MKTKRNKRPQTTKFDRSAPACQELMGMVEDLATIRKQMTKFSGVHNASCTCPFCSSKGPDGRASTGAAIEGDIRTACATIARMTEYLIQNGH